MVKLILLSLLEMTSKKIVMTTGKKAPVSGIYRSGKEYIPLSKGERFPPSIDLKWILVVSI
jgi:hypothetical protein